MNSTRDTQATLLDLLDRVLDKGLMLDADVIIHVAGIPLLGLKLRAALAGMETMLKYGIWEDWDQAQRLAATEEQRRKKENLPLQSEEVKLTTIAAVWYGNETYHAWRPGILYVTDIRIFLLRKDPAEILFETTYSDIKGIGLRKGHNDTLKEIDCLILSMESGESVSIRTADALSLKESIEERIAVSRRQLNSDIGLVKALQAINRIQ